MARMSAGPRPASCVWGPFAGTAALPVVEATVVVCVSLAPCRSPPAPRVVVVVVVGPPRRRPGSRRLAGAGGRCRGGVGRNRRACRVSRAAAAAEGDAEDRDQKGDGEGSFACRHRNPTRPACSTRPVARRRLPCMVCFGSPCPRSPPCRRRRRSPSASAPTSCSSSWPRAAWRRCTSRAPPTGARGRRSSP